MVEKILSKIKWLGHAGFLLQIDEKNIYIDPYEIVDGLPVADIIMITHEHYDHCSPADIGKVQGEKTVIITEVSSVPKLSGEIITLAPGESLERDGVNFAAVPAYNTNKDFHPKKNCWLGFVIKISGVRIYHAGDTDYIPEMKDVEADIALMPVSGTYVMTAREAARGVLDIKPAVAVPMHCGSLVGTMEDAKEFAEALSDKVKVKIL